MHHLLLVEDDEIDRGQILRHLNGLYRISTAPSVSDLIERVIADDEPDLVLLDMFLPDHDGLEALTWLAERDIPTVVLTGSGNESLAVQAMKLGASDYLSKDRMTRSELTRSVASAIEVAAVRRALRESQRRTEESEERLRLLIAHIPAAVAMLGRSLQYLAWSNRWTKDFCLESGDLAGQELGRTLPNFPAEWMSALQDCLKGRPVGVTEEVLTGLDGKQECVRMEAQPWHADGGAVGGVILYCEFVTAQRQADGALRDSERKVARAERVNVVGALAAELTHRIRQPLFAIRNFCQAQERALRGESVRLTNGELVVSANGQILAACDKAAGVIDELVEVTRKANVEAVQFDLRDATSQALAILQSEIKNRGGVVVYQPGAEPLSILGSPADTQYAIICLLRSFLKALPANQRTWQLTLLLERDTQLARLLIRSDCEEALRRSSDLLSPPATMPLSDSGISSSNLKTLVERCRGRIWCEEGPGGPTVCVSLPLTVRSARSGTAP